jgi:hypothetical protein
MQQPRPVRVWARFLGDKKMRKPFLILLALTALYLPARADSCDTLISTLESNLANPGASQFSVDQLQRLLEAGRAAKAAGNIKACEAAMSSPTATPPGGHKCEKSQNTV